MGAMGPVRPIITLTSDFGTVDFYVAAMKAALLRTCPDARLIDVTHGVPRHDILCGSITLERAVEGEGRETQRVALGWERQDLERLLENDGDITLTFDEAELQQLLDEDVEAHGMRERLAVLTVVAAGIAARGESRITLEGDPRGATVALTRERERVNAPTSAPFLAAEVKL